MKILFLLLVIACGNKSHHHLPPHFVAQEKPAPDIPAVEAESNFKTIIRSQEAALSSMKETNSSFHMNEMVTDIAVARTGLLGLSALKANNGVEIKWGRRSHVSAAQTGKTDLVIEEGMDVVSATEAVADLAVKTGKVKDTPKLRSHISQSLSQVQKMVQEIGAATLGKWHFKGIRFDLNFSTSGEVFFFTKAGPNLRLRLEWNHLAASGKLSTPGSRFILKTLSVLNQVNEDIYIPGFTAKQLSIGVGTTYKGEWGLWKYSSGFLGFLLFTPGNAKDNFIPDLTHENFTVGGFEEKGGTQTIPPEKFVEGLRKSLATAAFFAAASQSTQRDWYVKEIKTVNDLSYTGLFGLADYTTKGSMELDFKRNNY